MIQHHAFLQFLLNLLFGGLAFFVARYIVELVSPDDLKDKAKIATIVGLIAGVIVFALNFAANIVT